MMLNRSKLLLLVICYLLCLPVYAATLGYNKIVYFGDSLSDNGNLYNRTFGIVPKSPPYYEGRFSNGPTWAELVSKHFERTNKIEAENFAVGSSAAVFHNPVKGYLPYTLTMMVYNHIIRSAYSDRSHTLYVIWIGANDYLNGSDDVDGATTSVVNAIGDNIENLISREAKYFLIMNLPDFSLSPFGSHVENPANLAALAKMHNQKLNALTTKLQTQYPDVQIHLYNIYADFGGLLTHPEYYNAKYKVNLTNLTESCWGGGYTLRRDAATVSAKRDKLVKEIQSRLSQSTRLRDVNVTDDFMSPMDAGKLADTILNTPSLAAANDVGARFDEGQKPCDNPDNHLFWDKVHPSRVGHNVFSKIMIEFIEQNYS